MNALTTTPPASPHAMPALSRISPGLKSLLSVGDGPTAVREIAANPVMLAEARMALPALKQDALRPAGPEGVRRVVGKRRAMFPVGDRAPEEAAAWWEDYYAALADLPESALEAGMSAYIREPTSEFMPKPGRLRQLALSSENVAARAYERAKAAAGYQEPQQVKDPVSREAVQAMLAEYRERLPKKPEPVHRQFCGAPAEVDEQGLSPEMRASMARRSEA